MFARSESLDYDYRAVSHFLLLVRQRTFGQSTCQFKCVDNSAVLTGRGLVRALQVHGPSSTMTVPRVLEEMRMGFESPIQSEKFSFPSDEIDSDRAILSEEWGFSVFRVHEVGSRIVK